MLLPPLGTCTLTPAALSSPPCSGPVRHQCGVFCRRDGAPDADPDSRGLHAVCCGLLQCVWALHGRWHEEREATRRRQQRWGRQEEFWESLWQGQGMVMITILTNIKSSWLPALACFTFMRLSIKHKYSEKQRRVCFSRSPCWFMSLQQRFAEEVLLPFQCFSVCGIQLWFSFDCLSLLWLVCLLLGFYIFTRLMLAAAFSRLDPFSWKRSEITAEIHLQICQTDCMRGHFLNSATAV